MFTRATRFLVDFNQRLVLANRRCSLASRDTRRRRRNSDLPLSVYLRSGVLFQQGDVSSCPSDRIRFSIDSFETNSLTPPPMSLLHVERRKDNFGNVVRAREGERERRKRSRGFFSLSYFLVALRGEKKNEQEWMWFPFLRPCLFTARIYHP